MKHELGYGVGFRLPHYPYLLQNSTQIDYFEIISENFLSLGGPPREKLDWLKENHPIMMHGVSMSLGSSDPLNQSYLKKLKRLAKYCEPTYITDHLCWTSLDGVYLHDLLPLPYTKQVINHFVERIKTVQGFLEYPFGVENLSSYMGFKDSVMPEWEFVAEIVERADCYLMLDVNNIFVSSVNHDFNPIDYLNGLPLERVCQVHLAGHTTKPDGRKIDTHSQPVCEEVWQLYEHLVDLAGPVNTLVEWDDAIPSFPRLEQEVLKAKKITEKMDLSNA